MTYLRPRSLRSRGFTLVELMIVVAIMGILAAMAVAGYLKYIHNAQSSEAVMVMGQIRNGEESYRAETLNYLAPSLSLASYYPNANPDDSRMAWVQPLDARYNNTVNGWAMLNVHPDAPVRYGYAVVTGIAPAMPGGYDPAFTSPPVAAGAPPVGTPWFAVAARNSHNPTAPPSLLTCSSLDATIHSENDDN
jgi:type IV pilus assembly protein PilA